MVKSPPGTSSEVSPDRDELHIQAQLRMVERLQESERRYHDLIESLRQIVFQIDAQGRWVLLNKSWEEATGFTNSDAIGKPFQDFIHIDDRVAIDEQIKAVAEDRQEHIHTKCRFIVKDGTFIWVELRARSNEGSSGRIENISGTIIDITKRKMIEDALRESEERFQDFGASASDWYWEMDENLRFSYFSDRFTVITGVEQDVLLGKTRQENGNPGAQDEEWRCHLEALAAHKPFRNFVHPRTKPDGKTVWLSINGRPVLDANGEFQGFRGTGLDITDKINAENELRLAKEEADSANQAKSEFLSSMSHELRTPLNAIMGFAQILEMGRSELTEQQLNSVGAIYSAGDHLLTLINEVLELSKIEAGKMQFNMEQVPIYDLLNECFPLITTMSTKRNITVTDNALDCRDISVWADYTRLKQVILNILSNAVKYNHDGGAMAINAFVSGEMLRITVSDTGMGIPEAEHKNVFKPFMRIIHEGEEIEGTGIGLTLTKNIVEHMNGRIGFESVYGKGSDFWIELPVSATDETRAQRETPSTDVAEEDMAVFQEREHTILYVEDNPANLILMENIVAYLPNASMISAHTGELGIEMAEAHQPDLILMDINLPGIDGITALKRLRGKPTTSNIPVIAISAAAMKVDIEKGIRAGFNNYLTKPLNVSEVIATMSRNLQNKER